MIDTVRKTGILALEPCWLGDAGGVYQIINMVNGKCYIGSTVGFRHRWICHRGELRAGKHSSHHLQHAWRKYGEDAFEFEIIEPIARGSYSDKMFDKILRQHEQYWLTAMSPAYNMNPVFYSNLGMKHTPETKAKMSLSHKGKPLGPLSTDHRAALSAAMKGKQPSPKTMTAARIAWAKYHAIGDNYTKYEYQGEFKTLRQWAETLGWSKMKLYHLVCAKGLSFSDAINYYRTPGVRNCEYEAFGRRQTLMQWASEYNLQVATLRYRLRTGRTLEQSLSYQMETHERP